VEGRTHDYLVAADGRVIPGEFIPHLFQKAQGFDRYMVHQTSQSEIIVRIVPNEKYDDMENEGIVRVLKSHLGDISIAFEKAEESDMPSTRSGKLFFVKSEIKPDFSL
jgi:phenylacetate-CoA ligase